MKCERKSRKCDNEQNVTTGKIRPGNVHRLIGNLGHVKICFVFFTIITSLHNLAADSTANVAASLEESFVQPTKRVSDQVCEINIMLMPWRIYKFKYT